MLRKWILSAVAGLACCPPGPRLAAQAKAPEAAPGP